MARERREVAAVMTNSLSQQLTTERECGEFLQFFSKVRAADLHTLQDDGFLEPISTTELLANGDTASTLVDRHFRLLRERHVRYLLKGLHGLSDSYVCLDASRPWLVYWILHPLDVLDALHDPAPVHHPTLSAADLRLRAAESLRHCQHPDGGFGGGNKQFAHCAPTYAAGLALALLGGDGGPAAPGLGAQAWDVIDRPALYRWFLTLKDPVSGGFRMHEDGEVDARGTYTVVAIAALFNLLTPELAAGVAEFALACQTYEGGFAGEPGAEAHGGYVFCALAALAVLGRADDADWDALEFWLANRQMSVEGGFQGRANKLVDGCYSFWQGGTASLLAYLKDPVARQSVRMTASQPWPPPSQLARSSPSSASCSTADFIDADLSEEEGGFLCFNSIELQRYILLCAQQHQNGGLRDKPGKQRDFYHTCYNLSGLAAAQHPAARSSSGPQEPCVWGAASNRVAQVHPIFNIRLSTASACMAHFATKPSSHAELLAHPPTHPVGPLD